MRKEKVLEKREKRRITVRSRRGKTRKGKKREWKKEGWKKAREERGEKENLFLVFF